MSLTIDFETRSPVDIRKCGAWVYSEHHLTDPYCLAMKRDREPTRLWLPVWIYELFAKAGRLDDLQALPLISTDQAQAWIEEAETIEAHNAEFERAIWTNVQAPRYGWPAIPASKWRCSMAKSSQAALPRKLEKACAALGLAVQKDMEGNRIAMKLSKPRKRRKKEPENATGVYWHEDLDDFLRAFRYCMTDVEAEHALSETLAGLSPYEQAIYELDQKINARGVLADLCLANMVVACVAAHEARLLAEVQELTGGKIKSVKQRDAMLSYLGTECGEDELEDGGVELSALTKDTVAAALKREDLTPKARRLLEIRQSLAKASVSKYKAILARACADGRVRGAACYWGADTGRWAGRGVQLQNLPRGFFKTQADVANAIEIILSGDIELLEMLYGDLMAVASALVRSTFFAAEGHELVVADFASIEARGLFWLAGEEYGLALFRSGADLYCEMASIIYEYAVNKKDHPKERQVGKTAILGLGYNMGWVKFRDACFLATGILLDKKMARKVVKLYREKWKTVKDLWYEMEKAAIDAVQSGETVVCAKGKIKFRVRNDFLLMRLPSGRKLHYYKPALASRTSYVFPTEGEGGEKGNLMIVDVDGYTGLMRARKRASRRAIEEDVRIVGEPVQRGRFVLTHMGQDSKTKQWIRQQTYGGLLVENAVQALCRDLLADSMLRVEEAGYPVVLHVHDEAVAEVPEGFGSLQEFEFLMEQTPVWADGLPVAAEGWRGKRYRK